MSEIKKIPLWYGHLYISHQNQPKHLGAKDKQSADLQTLACCYVKYKYIYIYIVFFSYTYT